MLRQMPKRMELKVRVYALIQVNGKLLVCKELIKGGLFYKLPGGGLEIGESPEECLRRELKEELAWGYKGELALHGTPPFFIENAWNKQQQVIPLYYSIKLEDEVNFTIAAPDEIVSLHWFPMKEALQTLSLQSDQWALQHLL